MDNLPMFADILHQPESHLSVLHAQSGPGAPALAAAADLIRRCSGRVIVSGMGASFFALLPFVQRLQAAGKNAVAVESSELLYAAGVRWQSGDCAVLISRSGGSVEVLKLADSLRAAGVPLVGITNVASSPLHHAADAPILLGSLPDELIAVQSYTGTVLTLLLLAEAAITGSSAGLQERVAHSIPVLRTLIDLSFEQSGRWQPILAQAKPLYLLGRGSTAATVGEGSLLMHETAKAPTVAMASGQFRHGPVEAVNGEFCAVVVGTDVPTRYLDWKLALDLQRMGSRVLWVGPRVSDEPVTSMVSWPESISDELSPLFDIVPLQVAALRTAGWRGIVAGAFRFASEVTQDEASFPFFEAKAR